MARSKSAGSAAVAAPPMLDDAPTTAPPALPKVPQAAADPLTSLEWSGLDAVIVRIIQGTATLEDYEAAQIAGFVKETLDREKGRVQRVAALRLKAVPNARLRELEEIAAETSARVADAIVKENQRFDDLRADHEAKLRSLGNERTAAVSAAESARSARAELRSRVPNPVREVYKMRASAVTARFHESATVLEGDVRNLEGILSWDFDTHNELIRLVTQNPQHVLYNRELWVNRGFSGAFDADAARKWLQKVQSQIATYLPEMKQRLAQAQAEKAAAEAEVFDALDYYLPKA